MTRQEIESLPNWQASFKSPYNARVSCLIRNLKGGYYWQWADYDGLFAWGETAIYSGLADLSRLELLAGTKPTARR